MRQTGEEEDVKENKTQEDKNVITIIGEKGKKRNTIQQMQESPE